MPYMAEAVQVQTNVTLHQIDQTVNESLAHKNVIMNNI